MRSRRNGSLQALAHLQGLPVHLVYSGSALPLLGEQRKFVEVQALLPAAPGAVSDLGQSAGPDLHVTLSY